MPSIKDEDIIPWILDKFVRHGWWNKKHTNFDNIPKGTPNHLRDKIKEIAKELIKRGFLLSKPTQYGLEVSLNFAKKNEIFEIIEKWKLNR